MATSSAEPIGRGPVAIVYSGLRNGAPVALKVFPARFDRHTLKAFEREQARLASAAGVPSILPVRGVELLPDDRHALWMELCAQSLTMLVRRTGALPPGDGVVLGYALARALAAAHSAGVVHGGVNPNNVLFRTSGEPVLADFGVVLRHAFARDPWHAMEFQAPETAREQTLDERTDLYGLGATLHLALTGQPPHPGPLGEEPRERMLRVLRTPVPAIHRPGVPVELSTVVARMLAADPAHRPGSMAAVADQLAGMLGRHGDPPVPPAPPAPSAPPAPAVPSAPRVAPGRPAAPMFPPPVEGDGLDDFPARQRPGEVDIPDAPPATPAATAARWWLVVGGAGLAILLIVALVLVLGDDPDELTTTPRALPAPTTSESDAAAAVHLSLAEPTDLGDQVVLNWTGDPNLDFVVVVAPDGEPPQYQPARRSHTFRLAIDPNRKYCFQVRATTPLQTYRSEARSLHGAECHL